MVRWRESVLFLAERGRGDRRDRRRAGARRARQAHRPRPRGALGRHPGRGRGADRTTSERTRRRARCSICPARRRWSPAPPAASAARSPGRCIARAPRWCWPGRARERSQALAAELGERAHVATRRSRRSARPPTALVKEAEAALGQIDILVNNAGLTRDALALRMKDEDWQAVIDVDLTAAFRLTRAALRGMMRRRHGRIIAITSVVGVDRQSRPGELRRGQGGDDRHVEIDRRRGRDPRHHRQLRRPGLDRDGDDRQADAPSSAPGSARRSRRDASARPTDVAAAVVYLASAEAAYVTGHTLHVNGGMAMI